MANKGAKILLICLLLPLVEIYILILVGRAIGAGWTLGAVILTGVLGVLLAKRNVMTMVRTLTQAVLDNRVPTMESIDALFVVIGAVLLIIPGFISDAWGFCFLMGWSRKLLIQTLWPRLKDSSFYRELEQKLRAELIKKGHLSGVKK